MLEAGLKVEAWRHVWHLPRPQVATQFCFNPLRLMSWLHSTTEALRALEAEVGGTARLRVGVPGPTSLQRPFRTWL